jgi:uncharacterized repeat protein (TIGR04138 family)
MQHLDFEEVLDQILQNENRYDRQAYGFVREALDYTQKIASKSQQDRIRHVSGMELLEGVRKFAVTQFGPMTKTVLNEWGLTKTLDFGEIVFILIDYSVLAKTQDDKVEDFDNGFSFEDAFVIPFLPKRKREQAIAQSKTVSIE